MCCVAISSLTEQWAVTYTLPITHILCGCLTPFNEVHLDSFQFLPSNNAVMSILGYISSHVSTSCSLQ